MGKYTMWLPILIACAVLVLYLVLPVKPIFLGENGAIASALTLLSTLPGFYFAGLAAVATFGSQEMDREMPHPAPKIKILTRGQLVESKLTKRQFLSYLFSYLVLISFVLCVALMALNACEGSIHFITAAVRKSAYGWWITEAAKIGVLFVFSMGFGSLLISTLQGVFFLTEKVHQP
ncbi:hypothetical protein [Rhizobium sp. 768_B6_N1_8]|uniref:hypothetical protein n=1 Tax=unclassified Rhizobium TaxID=2613769 RepID=UPI003F1EA10D